MNKNKINRILETRALPTLIEQRNNLLDEMDNLFKKAETEENRAFNEDENSRFETIMKEISQIDNTLKAQEEARSLEKKVMKKKENKSEDQIINEELRSMFIEKREAMNTSTPGEGGLVVNEVLIKEIIEKLKDRSNVFDFFDNTAINGTVRIPKKATDGTASWVDQHSTPDSTPAAVIPTLEILELGQNRLYRESAITQQMLNSQEIDLKSFIINDISESMSDAIENAIFNGTGVKQPTGLLGAINSTKKISLDTRGNITVDHLKKCKAKLKKAAQTQAKWFMNANTLLEIDLLKDNDGRYILHQDITTASGYTLLGLPVEVTDAMPTLSDTGAKCVVVLAAPQAYHINMQKALQLYVYDDSAYKRAGLIGFASDTYLDGKVKNDDVLAGIFNKSA